jgi:hypothetical protein
VGGRAGASLGRGLSGHLDRQSTEDLTGALRCAESTLEQVAHFIWLVHAELTARGDPHRPPAA